MHIINLVAVYMFSLQVAERMTPFSKLAFMPQGRLPWQLSSPVFTLRMISYSLDLHCLWAGKGSSELFVPGTSGETKLEKV